MATEGTDSRMLEEYKAVEFEFHRELMNVCRKYLHKLGIASIVGIIDIVKNETIDLENATRQNIGQEETVDDEKSSGEFFS